MTDTTTTSAAYAPGTLVRARGREWVVLPGSEPDLLILRPLGGGDDDTMAVLPALESVQSAHFPAPITADLGDSQSAGLLRTALRIGFRASGGPFRSLANLAVEPRAYQYVPLLLALRQPTVRLLIADDVGIGKTIEAGLIAAELLAQGDIDRLAVLCGPALAEQWQRELREKFGIDAELVLPATVTRLAKGLLLNESLFDRYPFTVVSTDFIKADRRRHEFLNHCPGLVIVDEAHNAVADGSSGSRAARTQRYDLMQTIAKDPNRHLVLSTATPHSGKDEGFRNLLGLLDPDLASVDLDTTEGRQHLARHFVQRRRADIRHYLDEDTAFPSDRECKEVSYNLAPGYAKFFDQVLAYAREQVADPDDSAPRLRQRVRWWSVLALLRALASSPRAAGSTLRTRASAAAATTVEGADALGRAAVLDRGDDESLEGLDTTPGADTASLDYDEARPEGEGEAGLKHRKRLLGLARTAEGLEGPATDNKLARLITELRALLADGYDPIVFCRFIDTAEYVADHLAGTLGRGVEVAAVTGSLPPELREERIAELTNRPGRHVLVATDCLSEGVNLQDCFQAVVHYDLAWNPTRHEQREGRVDRFGQRRDIVRAVTLFGIDNRIDGIVLDVLLRKSRAIRQATGVSVPVPTESDNVVEALLEGLILRGDRGTAQLELDLGLREQRDDLHQAWESAAEREKRSQTFYAQQTIHPEEVFREVTAARAALGGHNEIGSFTAEALRALGATITATADGYRAEVSATPIGLRDALPPGRVDPLMFHHDLPAPHGHALLARTDPAVTALATYVLDTALDPQLGERVAARAGVMRTGAVARRSTVLLVRFRFHLDLPGATGLRSVVTEEARFLAFEGPPDNADWIDDPDRITALVAAAPAGNVAADQAAHLTAGIVDRLGSLSGRLATEADRLAAELLDAHRRVRKGAGTQRRGLGVQAQHPVDILGVYIYLPETEGS